MQDDDLELFQQMMGDVKPIEQDTAIKLKDRVLTEAHLARRQAAVSLADENEEYLSLDNAPMLKPNDILEYKKDGVQDGVFRKLRLGKYPITAKLDLHRRTLKQAREDVVSFLRQAQRLDTRSVLIVHGKGERSNPPALMKSYIATWLEQITDVMCFHSAQPFHGGSGAVYVLIKKSPEMKLDNRERHQKRMS
ncbi:DNA endonuclease SmrA [Vibrio rumoiensis]|uniref:DNA mismatch repair protein MutS n=1 Tax=Vibrio rumoiensis 1S-45 TaxID=1188252 RepID=A0A1E5E253_9VIBR|nr:DNA endonuclease SmrA [Vibrio rumoiensis]OEF25037.1 DNA mismatch repair protein MutS [Vibrio rumoiensis 1S-45]